MATYRVFPNNYAFTPDDGLKFDIMVLAYNGGSEYTNTGNGYISGTVKLHDNVFKNAPVVLFDETANVFVQETVTDNDGKYRFNGIDENKLYYVLVKDRASKWEHRVQSRVKPEI